MSGTTTRIDNNMSTLAQELFKRIDTNGDNRVSREEFQSFLQDFVQHLGHKDEKQTNGVGAITNQNGAVTNEGLADPSDYIFAGLPSPDDYAARGYDFDHPDPHHLKPIISKLLYSGQVAPTHDWVTPELVARLNEMAGIDPSSPDAFRALDSETIAFSGNEYVHSAPVGHGLLPGQYDPRAAGEFFWGWWDV